MIAERVAGDDSPLAYAEIIHCKVSYSTSVAKWDSSMIALTCFGYGHACVGDNRVLGRPFRGATWRIKGAPLRGSRQRLYPDLWSSLTRRLRRFFVHCTRRPCSSGRLIYCACCGAGLILHHQVVFCVAESVSGRRLCLKWICSRHRGPLRRYCVVPDSNITQTCLSYFRLRWAPPPTRPRCLVAHGPHQ